LGRAPRHAPADRRARGTGFWLALGAFWTVSPGTGVIEAAEALAAGSWRVPGGVWREAPARNAVAGWYAGRCARHCTRQRTGARAVRASGWLLACSGLLAGSWRVLGFWLAPGAFWAASGAKRWRVTLSRAGTPVGARATARASGRRARGTGFWLALGAFWTVSPGTGVIEAAQAFGAGCLALSVISPSRRYGHARSGTGASCGAARRAADDTSEAKRMIPKGSVAKRSRIRSGARRIRAARSAANDTSAQRRAAHQRNTRRIAGTGRIG